MIFIVIFTVTIAGALFHLHMQEPALRTKERIVEVFLLYFLSVQWGFGAVLTAIPHIVVPDIIAEYIGWARSCPDWCGKEKWRILPED